MKKLGFGFMRLPKLPSGEIDRCQTKKMVDAYLEAGFTYFDTAHNYLEGESEKALKDCLTSRYPRDRYILTNKLTNCFFERQDQIIPLMEEQLEACGVEYFDYVLMHAMNAQRFEKYQACHAFEELHKLVEQGKIRHLGVSFHDQPEVLDRMLREQPLIEVVQIQFNYLDVANPNVESRKVYEVCRKYGKPVLVMEPVKGGVLATLPEKAEKILKDLKGGSVASYAIRYAASREGILAVLSGMSTLEQVRDNISFMQDFQPLEERELAAIDQVRQILLTEDYIPCTGCRYCVDGCPMGIAIPDLLHFFNVKKRFQTPEQTYEELTEHGGKASDCVGCGQCEEACPQYLPIRSYLTAMTDIFE